MLAELFDYQTRFQRGVGRCTQASYLTACDKAAASTLRFFFTVTLGPAVTALGESICCWSATSM